MVRHDELSQTIERLARVMQNETHAFGLKPVQWEALRYLARANRFSRSPTSLSAYLGTTKGTVSQTVIALERKGLVGKEQAPDDKRNIRLSLTKDGRALLKKDPVLAICDATQNLAQADRETTIGSLQGILKQALHWRGQQAFGQCATCRFFEVESADGSPHFCSLLRQPLTPDDSQKICAEHQDAPTSA